MLPIQEGTRKLSMVYIFGFMSVVVYVFSARTVAEMTALFGFWTAMIGWYNQSNLAEHRINNGATKNEG